MDASPSQSFFFEFLGIFAEQEAVVQSPNCIFREHIVFGPSSKIARIVSSTHYEY